MMSIYPLPGHLDSDPMSRPSKRRIDDEDVDHFFKKRLLDNFENLLIFEGSRSRSLTPISTPPTNSKDKVYIDSIDQFLEDNKDNSDLESRPIDSADDVSKNTMKEIVIPEGFLKPLNEIFNQSNQNSNEKFLQEKKRSVIEKLMDRKKLQQRELFEKTDKDYLETDYMLDDGDIFKEPEVEISNSEIYYEAYISRYWSLIKYYNPKMLLFRTLQKWLYEQSRQRPVYKSSQIEELDDDGDNIVMSDSEEIPFTTSTPTHSKIQNNYGDYYGGDSFRSEFDCDMDDDDEFDELDQRLFFNYDNDNDDDVMELD